MKNIFCTNKKFAPKAKQVILALLMFVVFFSPLSVVFTTIENKNIITIKQNTTYAAGALERMTNPFECVTGDVGDIATGNGSFNAAQCFLGIPSFAIFYLSGMFMAGGGWVFDVLTAFSISPVVLGADFVKEGWETTRDLANMLFIFILLFIAIAMILQLDGYKTKDLLVKLIVVALLVNFSLFVSRVIIDAGNITALFFYQGISAPASSDPSGFFVGNGANLKIGELKGISGGFINSVNPQDLILKTPNFVDNNVFNLIFIYLGSAALFAAAGWIFFSIGFMFLGRIVALWLLMAIAPLAFAAMILPKTSKWASEWWAQLFSKSFCITVFLFFIWLISVFASSGFLDSIFMQGDSTTGDIITFMVLMTIKFGTLIALLYVAKSITQKSCGQIHGMSLDIGKKLAGVAGMAVGGVGGFAGRQLLGRSAGALLNAKIGDTQIREKLAGGGFAARTFLRTTRMAERGSFDVRKPLSGIEKIPGVTAVGADIGAFGQAGGKGGFAEYKKNTDKEKIASMVKKADSLPTTAEKELYSKDIKEAGIITRMFTQRTANQRKKATENIEGKITKEAASKETKKIREKNLIEAESKFYNRTQDADSGIDIAEAPTLTKILPDTESNEAGSVRAQNLSLEKEYNEKIKDRLEELDEQLITMKANDVNATDIANTEIEMKKIKKQLSEYKEIEKNRDWLERTTQRDDDVKARGESKKKESDKK